MDTYHSEEYAEYDAKVLDRTCRLDIECDSCKLLGASARLYVYLNGVEVVADYCTDCMEHIEMRET